MTFGIKKSHEMISYMLVGMTLLSAGITLLSEWKYRSSTQPDKLAQKTLDGLYKKSHKRFVLSKCPENAQWIKKDDLSFIVILLWSKYNNSFYTVLRLKLK
jgi:hypothetical protein